MKFKSRVYGGDSANMLAHEEYPRPRSWQEHKAGIAHAWLTPIHKCDWVLRWLAYYLSRWALLSVLEYLSTFSVLIAVLFYFAESGDRKKQKHYQAWQVINTAQDKGGSGGRIEAIQELNEDHVSLVGVDASGAYLQGVRLPKANLLRCDLQTADLRESILSSANLEYASLHSANFRNGDLSSADLRHAEMSDTDLNQANLSRADLTGVDLTDADLRLANLKGTRWEGIKAIQNANVYGVRNAPAGFVDWALAHGAISRQVDEQ